MKLFQRLRRRLFVFQIFLLLIGACCVAYSAQRTFEGDLRPDMTQKGRLIARSLAGQFERALAQGIAFKKLRGVDELFRDVREANSEILFIAALDGIGRERRAAEFVDGRLKYDREIAEVMAALPPDGDAGESSEPWIVSKKDALVASQPIVVGGRCVGWILVGIDADYVKERLAGLLYDILVVLAVSLLMTFELLLLIMANTGSPMTAVRSMLRQVCGVDPGYRGGLGHSKSQLERLTEGLKQVGERLRAHRAGLAAGAGMNGVSANALRDLNKLDATLAALTLPAAGQPVQGQQEALIRVRMPLFIFFLSEELSRAFFPIYAKSLAHSIVGVPTEIVISLPMILFMLVVAFSQPLGGPWAERLGPRRMMLAGSLIGAVGLTLTAFAWDFYSLMVWRMITAFGYGIVFVAGQSHVIAHTDSGNRAWGMAMFVGSVLAASICGPAIGGILADRIGYNWTFAVGAVAALCSGALAWRLLPATEKSKTRGGAVLRFKDVSLVLSNPRFVALVVGGAMPAKVILTGFLYYLAPLYLAQLGNGPSATGRILMLYGLMMVLMTPLAARLADRVRRPLLFVIAGGVISAAGVCGILWSSTTAMLIVAVLTLGFAQATSITPQLSLVPVACPEECRQLGQVTVVGFFRLFERIGSAMGPLIAAFLLQRCGYQFTAVAIGAGVATASILLGLIWILTARSAELSRQQLEQA
jgi:Arabinose efflux permease